MNYVSRMFDSHRFTRCLLVLCFVWQYLHSCFLISTRQVKLICFCAGFPTHGIPCSEPIGGSKVDSVFPLSEVDQMRTGIPCNLVVKSKMPPCSGSVTLRPLNPVHKKGT